MKLLSLIAVAAVLLACSSEKDDVTPAADASGSCTNLCAKSGFKAGRADVQPNEINCFCTDGAGTVAAAECTSMCSALGKSKSEPFGGTAGKPAACQCS